MNKKLLTLAVAAALAAPAIASAEAILYGKVNVSLDYADVTNVVLPTYGFDRDADGNVILDANGNPTLVQTAPGEDFKGWGMSGNGYIPGEGRASRLGVKGSEDLGNGLKAIYQVEFGINLNDTNNNVLSNSDSITYRNSFVGLAGNWGTLLGGRHDTPMKISTGKLDLFADTMADMNGTIGFRDLRADNVVAYISPNWSGFQLAAAIVPAGGATGGGNGLNLEEDELAGTYSIAAIYSNGPFYASAAFENLNNENFNDQDTSLNFNQCPYEGFVNADGDIQLSDQPYPGSGLGGCNYQDGDAQAWRIGLGLLDWNGFSLTAIYENQDQFNSDKFVGLVDPANVANNFLLPANSSEAEMWQVQLAYAFGNSKIKGMIGQASFDSDLSIGTQSAPGEGGALALQRLADDYDGENLAWAVGYDYNFSKRTTAYMLYTQVDADAKEIDPGSEWAGFSLGMMHSF
jgi:predicted porin